MLFWYYNNDEICLDKSNKKKDFMLQKKKKTLDVNIDIIVISKLIKTKTNSNYLIGSLDNVIRPLNLILIFNVFLIYFN